MSPFSFLILLIWTHSLCPLVSLAKGWSFLLIFLKEPTFFYWFSVWSFLFLLSWFPLLSLIISCLLCVLGIFASFYSRAFRCAVKLLTYALFCFFLQALRAMNFPLSTAFIVSHKFGYVVPSISLNSKKSFISFFISSLTKLSLSRALFNFHVYVGVLSLFLLLKTSLSPWWSDMMHGILFYPSESVDVCLVTNYIVSFGQGTMMLWEEGVSFCFRMECFIILH